MEDTDETPEYMLGMGAICISCAALRGKRDSDWFERKVEQLEAKLERVREWEEQERRDRDGADQPVDDLNELFAILADEGGEWKSNALKDIRNGDLGEDG
jgi:hypothetical protein